MQRATQAGVTIYAVGLNSRLLERGRSIDVCVGDPDAADESGRERRRRGRLVVDGLKFWSLEPPAGKELPMPDGLWLTADGALSESPTETGRLLAQKIDADDVNCFLYFSDLNTCGYLAGKSVSFTWS